ncbi:MAG: hypothetical protein AAF703_08090 [Cyanobacteria bacterium P01_D01_bin.105]
MPVNSKSSSLEFPKLVIPSILLLLGILLVLWMQTFVSDGVFFSRDAGLKALLSQQIAGQLRAGEFPLDMSLASLSTSAGAANAGASGWIAQLWSQGLYPITPPFVYQVGGQPFVTFSFLFPLLTAPFYVLFGELGLYLIPALALLAIWGRFWQIGLRANWDAASLSLGLFALVFASPLSLYGSTYWEQTLAVAIAFWGITALLYPHKKQKPRYMGALSKHPFGDLSGARLIIGGSLIGLSVWFRPEFLCLCVAAVLLACCGWLLPKWRLMVPLSAVDAFVFVGSMVCAVCVFLAINYSVYGHPLGLHGLQIIDEIAAIASIQQIKASYGQMLIGFWRYFPVAALVAIAALCSPEFKRSSLKTTNRFKGFKTPDVDKIGIISPAKNRPLPARAALVLCCVVALMTPLLLPIGMGDKQWGPRLYLILVPLLALVLAEQLQAGFFQNWARRIMLLGTAIALAFGIHINTLNGAFNIYQDSQTQSSSLLANYVSVAPALAQLKAQPTPWIATNNQSVTQQFWSALPTKTFFGTETLDEVKLLANALVEQNEQTFLYVCGASQSCSVPSVALSELTLESGEQLAFESLGQFGRYPLYKVEIAS